MRITSVLWFRRVIVFTLMLGFYAPTCFAMAPYIGQVKIVLSDNEPCFLAARESDLYLGNHASPPDISRISITSMVGQVAGQVAQTKLSSSPQECIKYSQVFPSENRQPLRSGLLYEVGIAASWDDKHQLGFRGYFCLMENEKGALRLAKIDLMKSSCTKEPLDP